MFERVTHRLTGSVLLWDIILTLISLYFTSILRLWIDLGNDLNEEYVQIPLILYIAVICIWSVIFLILTPQRALFHSSLYEALSRLIGAVSLSSLTFAGFLYLFVREVSRLQFLYFAFTNLVILLIFHILWRILMMRRGNYIGQRNVLLVGSEPIASKLIQEFTRYPWSGLKIKGYTSDTVLAEYPIPHLGLLDNTAEVVQKHNINEVIFVVSQQQRDRVVDLSFQLQSYPVMLHMAPDVFDLAFARTAVQNLGGVPLISLKETTLTEPQRMLKRAFDIIVSGSLLLLTAPLMVVIAIMIKIESSGPIFFFQERIGQHGQRFRMIKFRSMYADAEQQWKTVARRDEEGNLLHKSVDDPRITPFGRKLRRTSLDELPQLINVLRGEMSLVGPRPEMPYIAVEYEPWQWQRFRVPPGMTGWWQVNGRGDMPMHLHTEDDLYYIQNYSFWLDMIILLRTVSVVIRGQGAF